MSELLDPSDVALRLGVTTETVRQWAKEGKLASVVMPSGRRKFRSEDIDAIVDAAQS